MSVRTLAHATSTASALVSWGAVAWLLVESPTANSAMRLPFFTLLGIAVLASALCLGPLVVRAYLSRHMTDVKQASVASWYMGYVARDEECTCGAEDGPARPPAWLRVVGD